MVVTTEMGINYKVCSYERLYRLFHPDTSDTSETSDTKSTHKLVWCLHEEKKEKKEIYWFFNELK